MLRKIIMTLGLFVALLPYLGIPRGVDTVLYTSSGLIIFFLLVLFKKHRVHAYTEVRGKRADKVGEEVVQLAGGEISTQERELFVTRTSEEHSPHVTVSETVVTETATINETPTTETLVEKKVTVRSNRKKQADEGVNESSTSPSLE